MAPQLAVHHPSDPAAPPFDFWAWRLQRRFVVDRLLSLAQVEPMSVAAALLRVAEAFETETVTPQTVELLQNYLGRTPMPPLRDVLLALAERTRAKEAPLAMHWELPVIRPSWEQIPQQAPVFVGFVDGAPLRARLVATEAVIPAYALVWGYESGAEEAPLHIKHTAIGPLLPYAPAVWDWLVARHLTLQAHAGVIRWPNQVLLPLRLDVQG